MRSLGVDFGGSRIGIAVGDAETGLTSPRKTITASGTLARDAAAIVEAAKRESADEVVIGIPWIDGEETKMSGICRKLGEKIEQLGVVTRYVDEAMTTVEAESNLRLGGHKASVRKRMRDGEAACLILERYFDAQAR